MSSDYVEGFLEGHEGPGVKVLYRLFMFSYILLSLFSGICNIAAMSHDGAEFNNVINSAVILGLLAMSLVHVSWYRRDNLDPKHRKSSFLLILLVLLLDTAACIAFHRTLTYSPPTAPPAETPIPSTFQPFTFAPQNGNGTSAPTALQSPGHMRIN